MLLLAATPALAAPSKPAAPDDFAAARAVVADIDKIVTPHGVQETFIATLGGARQVVNVRGADRANPILIFIHGGPGAVEMPVAWSFQRPWEDYFTVVQYDQRGAGRSYPLNDPKKLAATLTPDRYRDDAIELIELLKQKYRKPKVFVLGHSWGSLIGLAVAAKRPDLLYAYIGMGQLIDFRENERQGFSWTLAQARADHNAQAVKELEAIQPYPGPGAFDVAKTTAERKWSIHYGALAAYRDNAKFYFDSTQLSPDYTQADLDAWSAGSKFTIATMFPQLSSVTYKNLKKLDVPVVFLLGRHDYTCVASIAADWIQAVSAPSKKLVWFENAAHLPMLEVPGRLFAALLTDVRPLAPN
jgi:pimeloyl-ACP methyl ester carboxylesterase